MKQLPENAQNVMVQRYSLRDENGKPVETPAEILSRTARVVAQAENNFRDGVTPTEVEEQFTELLHDFAFMPNGRTLANAGSSGGQLANCFVLPIEDELGKTGDGIFSILRKAVLVLQSGGGVGFSFGRVRPKGDVAGKGKATGAVSFLKVFDTAFWVIGQGGGRRSACMAVLPVHHPDIFDFIRCKEQEGVIEHFNISVGVTDAFMKAVEKDDDFDLINPRNNKVWETVRARDLMELIVEHAHHNGEPGVLFLDAANRENPVPHQYELEATNPCGEQWLGPYENCCMASVNLAEHVRKVEVKSKKSKVKSPAKGLLYPYEVDWEKLRKTVRWTVRWLDDVVEANKYVPAVPELEEAAHKNRRIGVSVMGMADMMYLMGVRYGSDEAVDLAGQLMEFIRFEAMQMSVELAEERGAFPGISGSIYDYSKTEVVNTGKNKNKRLDKYGRWQAPRPIKKYSHDFDRPDLDWDGLIEEMKKYGIRNSCQTTIQPTGAIATVAALEGYGCEPVFALSYVMKTHEGAAERGEDWDELYYESDLFKQVLKQWNEVHDNSPDEQLDITAMFEKVRAKGTCLDVKAIPELIRKVFVVSSDIRVTEHVKMQAALQAFTDNAISKTINFPATAQMDDVWEAYLEGWRLGLKGMTVYVTGSRETVVLETEETRSKSQKLEVRSQKLEEKEKKNGEKKKQPETVDIGPLMNTSHEPFVVNGDSIVGKPLKKVHPEEMSCPECGSMMVLQEGCATCPQCAYSHCSV